MTVRYQMHGQGEPLLVLSGYGVRSSVLAPVVAPLAEHFTCLTFDYPVSGGPLPFTPLSVPAMAASAVAVLDRAGHASAHVLGISLGGMVAQEMAIRFPDRVRGLVLAATTPGGPRSAVPDPWTLLAGFAGLRGTFPAGPVGVGRQALLVQTLAASLHDTSRRLRRIQARTLVVHGERDVLVPSVNADLLHRGIRGSTLHLLRDAGHAYFFENSEEAAGIVVRWIREARPQPGRASGPLPRVVERVDRAFAPQFSSLRLMCDHGFRTATWLAGAGVSRDPSRAAPAMPRAGTARTTSAAAR